MYRPPQPSTATRQASSLMSAAHDPRIAPPPPSRASTAPMAASHEPYSTQNAGYHRREAEMPRSASVYTYPPPPPPAAMPVTTAAYPPESGYASFRPETSRYHVAQAGRGSVKKHPDTGERKGFPQRTHGRSHPGSPDRRWGYREGPQDPSSAPPLGSRRMPPPSPPQHYPSRSQPGNAPAHFLSREPPNSASAHHRPGSSMSISSMLGVSEADRPARDVGSSSLFSRPPGSSVPFGSAPSSTPGAMSPPTAPTRPSALDFSPFRRSHTPEKAFSKVPPGKPYRSNSGGMTSSAGLDAGKFGNLSRAASLSQFPDKPRSAHPSPKVSSAEAAYPEPRRMSFSGPTPRPNSQPQHLDAPSRPAGYSPLARPSAGPEGSFGQRAASYMGHESHHSRYNLYGDRHLEEQAQRERERALAHENESKASSHPSRYPSHYSDRDAAGVSRPQPAWDMGRSQPPSPEAKRFPAGDTTGGFGFGAIQSYTKSLGSQVGGSRQAPLSIQPRQGQPTPPPQEQQSSYLNKLQTESRLFPSSSSGPPSLSHTSMDDQRRKGSEELLQHRNLLAVGLDAKRGGRASPLPQAVQGAQAQILGPAGEAGIKSELGRVFSGIGSGVGGVTAGSSGSGGPSTPMAASPFKRDSITARSTNSETTTDETRIGRPTSAMGKRSRKSRDEDMHAEPETGLRGETSTRGVPMREPRTVVTIEPVLSSVAHLPRHHLGSTLYTPRIGTPTDKASLESAKFGYTTTPEPLPRFEGKENCTFTVRVPRYRVDASHREEICARRALWGTGIYTDDSDPVAAAIHSGYIRGAWGEEVEESMLDLEIKDAYQHAPKSAQDIGLAEGDDRPLEPPVPPTDKDLHITLLILPRLERYDASVLFGVKSRPWEGTHDGVSFKVLRVEWVEEGVGRGEERGGAARRKRLRNLMQSGRICTGPGVVKLEHLRNGIPIPRRTSKAMEGQEQVAMQTVS
ncbi:hypothetical protein FE257_009870 [Aspergillus nanangensis]|uniref:Uncharacterized protein n=1 Tax=Aspergillus nanangensis TaxID=2582783 RepID=A0AAD4CXV1_ASPNN|nr:hypothetical protein FE257_009870 [Aspergillus nanangensis]